MRGAKFFGIGAALVVCILSLALVVEGGFISVAEAKKPDWGGPKPETTMSYGYARLRDAAGDEITSDDGQYIDKNVKNAGGTDEVEITTDENGNVVKVWAGLGSIQYESLRRVCFGFGITGTKLFEKPEYAVYDILVKCEENLDGTLDGAVHLGVGYWSSEGAVDYVAFIIDPNCDGTHENAITQEAVNAYYSDDTDENYRSSDSGHVIYYLRFPGHPNSPCLIPAPADPDKWTFTFSGTEQEPVTLYVMRTVGRGKSKGGAYERVDLSEYGDLQFGLAVSLDSLSGGYPSGNTAPRKHSILSAVWGEIKAR